MRLDQHMFTAGLSESREKARALIMAGLVYVNGDKADKPGMPVPENAQLEVRSEGPAYVSRGGLKLEKAMEKFPISPEGLVCMDVGASTGGFTDCMLQNGAKKVYAIDVGYGQLAWKLRCDDRVVVMERTNIRHVEPAMLQDEIQFFSVDVSFISLKLVLPVLRQLVVPGAVGVCLVKPQFEAGKDKVGKKGVVRDVSVHKEVLHQVFNYAEQADFCVTGLDYSPIKGPQGNIEYLLCIQREDGGASLDTSVIETICRQSHTELD